jgi:hypothetical protein
MVNLPPPQFVFLGFFEGCGWVSLPFYFFILVLEWLGVGTSPFFVFRELRGVYKSISFLKCFLEGWGTREKSFLFCFLKAHGSMLCTLNPQKKMDLHTAPNLPNKKELLSTPQSFKNKKKTCSHPASLQKPQKMMFSHSPPTV